MENPPEIIKLTMIPVSSGVFLEILKVIRQSILLPFVQAAFLPGPGETIRKAFPAPVIRILPCQ